MIEYNESHTVTDTQKRNFWELWCQPQQTGPVSAFSFQSVYSKTHLLAFIMHVLAQQQSSRLAHVLWIHTMLMVSIIGEDFAALSLAVSIALCEERTVSCFTLGTGFFFIQVSDSSHKHTLMVLFFYLITQQGRGFSIGRLNSRCVPFPALWLWGWDSWVLAVRVHSVLLAKPEWDEGRAVSNSCLLLYWSSQESGY